MDPKKLIKGVPTFRTCTLHGLAMPYKRRRSASRGRRKRARTSRKPLRKSFMRRNVARIARQVVLRAAESKSKIESWGKFELMHNTLTATLTHGCVIQLNDANRMPSQGGDDHQRNGDTIIGRGWKVRMTLANKADRPNCTYRIMVVARQMAGQPGYSHILQNVSGNVLLDSIDPDTNTILYHKIYKPNRAFVDTSESGAREYVVPFKFFIPRKKIIKFDNNGYVGNDKFIWLIVCAYDAYGTLLTDNIAYTQIWTQFMYKDP